MLITRGTIAVFSFLVLLGCSDARKNEENLDSCIAQWAYRYSKIELVDESIRQLGVFDEFIVLKQGAGASVGGLYDFLFLGISEGKGILLYMGDSIKKPVIKHIELARAKSLISEGKTVAQNNIDSELNLDVNGVSCTFIKYSEMNSKDGFEHSFSGFTNHMNGLHQYILNLNVFTSDLASEVEKDGSNPLDGKDETQVSLYKNKLADNNFLEVVGAN